MLNDVICVPRLADNSICEAKVLKHGVNVIFS